MPPASAISSRISFFGLDAAAFDATVVGWGWPRFRAQQVRDWVYGKGIADPALMTNLSKRDRDTLAERLDFATARTVRHQQSTDGTIKLLLSWGLSDRGQEINAETVMIPDQGRFTACLSSQVGCPVGCKFCASGINGVKGNLTAAQIVEQVWELNREMAGESDEATERRSDGGEEEAGAGGSDEATKARSDAGGSDEATKARSDAGGSDEATKARSDAGKDEEASSRLPSSLRRSVASSLSSVPSSLRRSVASSLPHISNLVFMGMGEPLANYANVMQAIRVLHDPKCFNLGARRITVSTVGVPEKMRQLAHEDLPLNLAISLHAPNEPLRKQLIPWAEHFPLNDILDAARYYFTRTGREVTLEYILLSGVNDRPDHARELARLCKTLRANVNLIRYNEVTGLPYQRPKSDDVINFQNILRNAGVNAHVRKSRGRDIDAACGQLRRKEAGAGRDQLEKSQVT